MKYAILPLTLLTISCHNDDPGAGMLLGRWNRIRFCGDLTCSDATADNRVRLTIDPRALTMFHNDTVFFSSVYTRREITTPDHEKGYEIKLSNGEVWRAVVQQDQLRVTVDMFDSSVYDRIR